MKLTLAEVAIGAGAVLEAPASVANAGALVARGYSIDSRTVAEGELFFAVRGERHDGHDFRCRRYRTRRCGRGGFARAGGYIA
jgi:UDP-N-acetylmuramoyl-tripeptide--D-alanyl-D-alanine ligase